MRFDHVVATAVAVTFVAAGAGAQSNIPSIPEKVPEAATAAGVIDDTGGGVPRVQEHNGIKYISGGAGSEEADALNRLSEDEFNLEVTMAVSTGQFTSPRMLRIEDRAGKEMLAVAPNGPIFLAKVPPGDYVIEVDAENQTVTRTVSVPASGQEAVALSWPGGDMPSRTGDAPVHP